MWTGASATFAGGVTGVEYDYDPAGRLVLVREVRRANATLATSVETRSTFDYAGELTSVAVTQGAASLRHTSYQYHADRGWLMGVTNRAVAGGTVLSDFAYMRRADGQITQVVESVKQPNGTTVTTTATFGYDALNRLTSQTVDTSTAGGDYTKSYTLDLVGNRTRLVVTPQGQSAVTTNSTYDARDRLLTEATGSQTIAYGYDANGSLTTRHENGVLQSTQAWDVRGRLAELRDGVGALLAKYGYTADGIRSEVTEGTTTTDYVIDALSPSGYQQVVEERASGLFVVSYVYGASLDPISTNKDINGTPSSIESVLFLGDGHSGVRQALGAAAAVLLAQRFDAFGNKLVSVGTFVTPIGYRGERFDAMLGQYYLRARFYDPRTGRFTAMDPFAGNYTDPLQMMRYGYGGMNPVFNTDPSGRFLLGAGIGIVAGLGIAYGAHAVATWTSGGWVGAAAGALFGFEAGYILGLVDAAFDTNLTTMQFLERAAMSAIFGMALGALTGSRVGPPWVRFGIAAGVLVLGGVMTYRGVTSALNNGNTDLAGFRGFTFATALSIGLKLSLGRTPAQGANADIVPRPANREVVNGLADFASGEPGATRPSMVALGGFRGFFMSGKSYKGENPANANHPVVNNILARQTHRNFGGCAECNVITRALLWIEFQTGRRITTEAEARQWLSGGWVQTARVGAQMPPAGQHQQPVEPCCGPGPSGGCAGLLEALGISYIF